jgi:predicted Rossmann fold nucleotide-binding protein DprA/Smf involved in DNA uptake
VLGLLPRAEGSGAVLSTAGSGRRAASGSGQMALDLRPSGRVVEQRADGLDEDGNALVELLHVGPLWPDEICQGLGLSAPRVQELILTLTLENVVVSEPSGRVILVSV